MIQLKPSSVRFNILVVDDDSTSISIVAAMLKRWDYDVVKVTRPVDALPTIRSQQQIDLVITDLHMPEMNGLELQQQINEEFIDLPVMIMSCDDRKSVIRQALESGVVFYMVKPLKPDEIASLWQYAVTSKVGKSIHIEEIGSFQGTAAAAAAGSSDDAAVSASSVNRKKKNKKVYNKRTNKTLKNNGKRIEEEGETVVSAPKKAKLAWTTSLHNRFLQAIRFLGLDKAVPLKILDYMNVPGLSRENVASHLQKYRIFLKKVADRGAGNESKSFTHRSRFAAAHSVMMLQEQFREKEEEMLRSSQHLARYGGGIISGLNGSIIGSTGFPSLGASSSNSVSQLGLLGNPQANLHHSLFANTTNPLHQADPSNPFGTGSNEMRPNSLSCGASSFKGLFGTSGWNPSYTSGLVENMGTIDDNPNSNYAEMGLNDDVELVGGTEGENGATNGLMGNATVHHLAPAGQSSSPAGSFANEKNYHYSPLKFAGVNERENTSGLLHQHGLGGDNAYNDLTNFGMNTAQPEQFGEGVDFSSLLFDPSDDEFFFQQQGGEDALNPNSDIGSGTHQADQLNLPINDSQNPGLSAGAFAVADNAPSPWNELTLEQLREIEQILHPESSGNDDDDANADPFNDYDPIPSFDQNADELHQSNQKTVNTSDELNGLMIQHDENSLQETGDWDDEEFINSIFQDEP